MQQRSTSNALVIDVSRWQGDPNWAALARENIAAGYAKATDGATGRDPTFVRNYAGMKRAGIARGAYAFAHPGTSSAESEADTLVDVVLAAGGFDLDPMLDLEVAEGQSPQQLAKFVLAWESRVRQRTGRGLILYSYSAFIVEYLTSVVSQLNHMRLWLANYGDKVPTIPGWDHWTLLQYSEHGRLQGIAGDVDLDAFAGTAAEIRSTLSTFGARETNERGEIGMTPEQITQLQVDLKMVLNLHDKPSDSSPFVNGQYDDVTRAAVKSFQYRARTLAGVYLKVDGIAGTETLAALNKAVEARRPAEPKTPEPASQNAAPVASPVERERADKAARAMQLIQQGLDILKTL